MKRILIVLTAVSFLAACAKTESGDKKAELESLKKQQSELTTKIAALEAEISKENPGENQKVKFVSIDTLKTVDFTHYVEVHGQVQADQNVNIIPRAMGPVVKVYAQVGDRVKKGQVLAKIDDALIRKSIDELNTRLELLTTIYNKQKNLWDQKIGTEVAYLQAKNNKEALENSIATAKEQLDNTNIKSPIDGIVDQADVKEGQMVSPGAFPAFRVVNFSQLRATAELAESYLNTVNTGDDVVVMFPDLKEEVKSKIDFAANAINPVSRTFKVEVKLSNNKNYRPNMLSVMKIIDYKAAKAITVPMNIIQSDQAGNYVYIVNTDGAKLVVKKAVVTVGEVYRGTAEIKAGLKAGDKIITAGYQDLNEGDIVKL
jgi:membrane fusion protein (multidrug efflux system)